MAVAPVTLMIEFRWLSTGERKIAGFSRWEVCTHSARDRMNKWKNIGKFAPNENGRNYAKMMRLKAAAE